LNCRPLATHYWMTINSNIKGVGNRLQSYVYCRIYHLFLKQIFQDVFHHNQSCFS
jgi:hypothetical protein